MQFKLLKARLAFPAIWTAEQVQGQGKPAFSCTLLIPRNHQQLASLESTILHVANEKWGAKTQQVMAGIKAKDALCVHNGDAKAEYDGFPGNLYITARNEARPLIVDRNRTILTQADGKPYAGCYVNAVLDIWAQDNKFGRRINASLSGLQFEADGDPFAGGVPAQVDDFDDLDASGIPPVAGGGSLF